MLLSPVFRGATFGGSVVFVLAYSNNCFKSKVKDLWLWCEEGNSKQEHKEVVVKGTTRVETSTVNVDYLKPLRHVSALVFVKLGN